MNAPLIQLVAWVFSTLGNPLLTSAFLLGAACLRFVDSSRAMPVLLALVLLLLLPIALWNFGRVRSGHYSDFDVSRREDRSTMYPLVVGLTLLATGALFLTGQPGSLWLGILFASFMTAVAAWANRWTKISLHASFAFFCAIAGARLSMAWDAPSLVFAVLVACSRFILKRHTVSELIFGTALGLTAGSALLVALRFIDHQDPSTLR